MRKILSLAALALSSGAAVIAVAGAAHASGGVHNWCAAPTSAERFDATCITGHSTLHVSGNSTDLESNWCLGALSARGDVVSAPVLACDKNHPMKTSSVPGPPPVSCPPPVCHPGPPTPPPPPPVCHPQPHPCPPPPPPPVPCPPHHHWDEGPATGHTLGGFPVLGDSLGNLL